MFSGVFLLWDHGLKKAKNSAILSAMKNMFFTLICLFCALLLLSGCNSTPVRQAERAMLPAFPVSKDLLKSRSDALRSVLSKVPHRGVGIKLSAYRHKLLPGKEIIELVKSLGFNRIYCYVSSETELSEDLTDLVVKASAAGIPVEILIRQGDFKRRLRGNALIRFLLPQFRTLPELAEDIAEFNSSLPPKAKLAGVTVRFEPHLFTYANGADKIPGLIYIWDVNTFGPGLDNDQLAMVAIEQLKKMKKNLGTLPFSIELPDFYPAMVAENKLSVGRVKDFSSIGKVIIQCSGNRPSELVKLSSTALSESKDTMVVIPLAEHTSVRSGALRRRNWSDFVRAVDFFINSARKNNCSGVILRPLSELGYMLLEQE